jgi:hypothetical protein
VESSENSELFLLPFKAFGERLLVYLLIWASHGEEQPMLVALMSKKNFTEKHGGSKGIGRKYR